MHPSTPFIIASLTVFLAAVPVADRTFSPDNAETFEGFANIQAFEEGEHSLGPPSILTYSTSAHNENGIDENFFNPWSYSPNRNGQD
ncbi:hypothetical protein N7540_003374 [Penicillium herquei]|nr:hypothetical protein N7540_003374 [Penicillium herquei]